MGGMNKERKEKENTKVPMQELRGGAVRQGKTLKEERLNGPIIDNTVIRSQGCVCCVFRVVCVPLLQLCALSTAGTGEHPPSH